MEGLATLVNEVCQEELGLRLPAFRNRLPDERQSITHHFLIYATVAGEVEEVDGYVTVGRYPQGSPGEIFIRMGQEHGSTVQGFADLWATAFSMLLQFGVPMEVLTTKFRHVAFEPSGRTNNPEIAFCRSLPDYVCAWLDKRFGKTA